MKIVYNQDGLVIEQHESGNSNELRKKYFPDSTDTRYEESQRSALLVGKKGDITLYYLLSLHAKYDEPSEDELIEGINTLIWRLKKR